MLKILQAKLQQKMNRELPDVQAGFRKGRGTREQIMIIHWCRGSAPVDPGWFEGGDGVGVLEKTYLITDIEGD